MLCTDSYKGVCSENCRQANLIMKTSQGVRFYEPSPICPIYPICTIFPIIITQSDIMILICPICQIYPILIAQCDIMILCGYHAFYDYVQYPNVQYVQYVEYS